MFEARGNMIGDPQRVGGNCQRRIRPRTGREEGTVHDIKIIDPMRLVVFVEHTFFRRVTETTRSARMTQRAVALGHFDHAKTDRA